MYSVRIRSIKKFFCLFLFCWMVYTSVWTWETYHKRLAHYMINNWTSELSYGRLALKAEVNINCPNISISALPLPLTVLVSFPGSGNTWTRHLLERMTGIATGSDLFDQTLETGGFVGERRKDRSVIAVKTHGIHIPSSGKPLRNIERAILIIRNPYDAMLADFHRHHSKSHVGTVSLTIFINNWNRYYREWAPHWYNLNHSWITTMKRLVVLFYEHFQSDLRQELARLSSFLKNDSFPTNIDCAMRNSEGKFHRNSSERMPTSFFYDSNQVAYVNSLIDRLDMELKAHNYTHFDILTYKASWH